MQLIYDRLKVCEKDAKPFVMERIEMKKKKKPSKRLGINYGFFPNPADNPLGRKGTTIICIPSIQRESLEKKKRMQCDDQQKPEAS